MSKNQITDEAKAIAIILTQSKNAHSNGFLRLQSDSLLNMCQGFVDEATTWAIVNKCNSAPVMPGDDQGTETRYPGKAGEQTPTPLPVPDASKTETGKSQTLSTTLPDYGTPAEFLQHIGRAVKSAEKLFEIESENNQDKSRERDTLHSWLSEAKLTSYGL